MSQNSCILQSYHHNYIYYTIDIKTDIRVCVLLTESPADHLLCYFSLSGLDRYPQTLHQTINENRRSVKYISGELKHISIYLNTQNTSPVLIQ